MELLRGLVGYCSETDVERNGKCSEKGTVYGRSMEALAMMGMMPGIISPFAYHSPASDANETFPGRSRAQALV